MPLRAVMTCTNYYTNMYFCVRVKAVKRLTHARKPSVCKCVRACVCRHAMFLLPVSAGVACTRTSFFDPSNTTFHKSSPGLSGTGGCSRTCALDLTSPSLPLCCLRRRVFVAVVAVVSGGGVVVMLIKSGGGVHNVALRRRGVARRGAAWRGVGQRGVSLFVHGHAL